MEHAIFEQFCADAGTLSVGQIRKLNEMLKALDARIEVSSRIDARRQELTQCLYCGGDRLHKWGATRTGLQRLRCAGCQRTFSSSTNTAMEGIRLPELFLQVVRDMFADTPLPCRTLAERLGLDKMTVWRWRQRIILALTGVGATGLEGIVEADEKYFRESRKGSREWVKYTRDSRTFSRPDRPRWRDYRKLGLLFPTGGSKYFKRVLTISDRSGGRRADVMPDRAGPTPMGFLARHIGKQSVLCSDGDTAYAACAGQYGIPHYVLDATKGPTVLENVFHIQTINSLHRKFNDFMSPFRGPASKHLPAYSAWFIARLGGDERAVIDGAWRRLLST